LLLATVASFQTEKGLAQNRINTTNHTKKFRRKGWGQKCQNRVVDGGGGSGGGRRGGR
jgi:hypothetical protein